MRRALGLSAVIVVASSFAGTLAQEAAPMQDTWESKDAAGQTTMTLVLGAEGKGSLQGNAITYTVSADKLTITDQGETIFYKFKLEGDTLTIAGGDLAQPLVFSRKAQKRAG